MYLNAIMFAKFRGVQLPGLTYLVAVLGDSYDAWSVTIFLSNLFYRKGCSLNFD